MLNRPRSRSWTFLILVIVAIVALILHESGQLQPVEDLAQYVIGPVQRSFAGLTGGSLDFLGGLRDTRELREENRRRLAENDRLASENIHLKEIESENGTLRELLQFKRSNPSYTTLPADVIGRDPSPYFTTVIINAGESLGLRPGMPVITGGSALVGRVIQVNPRTSKVQLLEDVASSVNATIQSSRATGLVKGQADGTLAMEFIPMEEKVTAGDVVLSSGLGGDLPKALVIGQVTEVIHRDIDLFQSATIKPAVDLNRLEVVLVILNFDAQPSK